MSDGLQDQAPDGELRRIVHRVLTENKVLLEHDKSGNSYASFSEDCIVNGIKRALLPILYDDDQIALEAQIKLLETAETLIPTGNPANDEIWFTVEIDGEMTPMRRDTLLATLKSKKEKA